MKNLMAMFFLLSAFLMSIAFGYSPDQRIGHGQRSGSGPMHGLMFPMGMWGVCNENVQIDKVDTFFSKQFIKLNLDENQKVMLNEYKVAMKEEMKKKIEEIRVLQAELASSLLQDKVDMKIVEMKVRSISDLKAEMQLAHLKGIEGCKEKLTLSQQKKLMEMMKASLNESKVKAKM